MAEKINNNSSSLKWQQNGELAHKDLAELIERLKNVESEHTSSELSRLSPSLSFTFSHFIELIIKLFSSTTIVLGLYPMDLRAVDNRAFS